MRVCGFRAILDIGLKRRSSAVSGELGSNKRILGNLTCGNEFDGECESK